MVTLQNIKKTDRYEERINYNSDHPEDTNHVEFTNLIDSFIEVALHMKKISDLELDRGKRYDLDFLSYCNIYGIDDTSTGVMQNLPVPLVYWNDKDTGSYSIRYNKTLRGIFDNIFIDKISHDEIVETVEAHDMWWNS